MKYLDTYGEIDILIKTRGSIMLSLYEIGNTVFRAKTQADQQSQQEIFKQEIERHLREKDEAAINELLQESEENGKLGLTRLSETLIEMAINTILFDYHGKPHRSDLFFLPLIITHKDNVIHMMSLGSLEEMIRNKAKEFGLLANDSELFLAPTIISQKTSKTMGFSNWYDLHQQTLRYRQDRSLRAIFTQDFHFTNSTPNSPVLVFIPGIIISSTEQAPSRLFGNNVHARTLKQQFSHALQQEISDEYTYELGVLEPNPVLFALSQAYDAQQDVLIYRFVDVYSRYANNRFILLPVSGTVAEAVLVAWDEQSNDIYNYVLLEVTKGSLSENLDAIMDYCHELKADVFVGETIVAIENIQNYKEFNMKKYVDENSVNMISSEGDDIITS